MLNRLGKASKADIKTWWMLVRSILSDLYKENKTLGNEIKGIIGSKWLPGQLFCVLHYVLSIPEAIKSVFSTYQEMIVVDNPFPETTGFEMNVDEKITVVHINSLACQCLEQTHDSFTKYAEERGIKNVGHTGGGGGGGGTVSENLRHRQKSEKICQKILTELHKKNHDTNIIHIKLLFPHPSGEKSLHMTVHIITPIYYFTQIHRLSGSKNFTFLQNFILYHSLVKVLHL